MLFTIYEDDPQFPRCPVCGAETADFYRSTVTGEIVGCYECIKWADGWEETA